MWSATQSRKRNLVVDFQKPDRVDGIRGNGKSFYYFSVLLTVHCPLSEPISTNQGRFNVKLMMLK